MAQEKGAHKNKLDERLAEARDEVLIPGEEIVAEETGDQGQAIVLTNSRVIIVKAGIAATGELNGRKASAFAWGKITGIKVRKGPMGAIIQICHDNMQPVGHERPPDNVVVFGAVEKVRRCDAIVSQIETLLGITADRVDAKQPSSTPESAPAACSVDDAAPATTEVVECAEATAQVSSDEQTPAPESAPKRRGGRVAKSLAEEMFEEMTPEAASALVPEQSAAESISEIVEAIAPVLAEPVVENTPASVETVIEEVQSQPAESIVEDVEDTLVDLDESPQFRPNPKLPKPVKKRGGPTKVFALFGALIAMVLVCMAVTQPLRQPEVEPSVDINVSKLTHNPKIDRQQIVAIIRYRSQARKLISAARNADATDASWKKMNELSVPLGLAAAKDNLVSGLFVKKTAFENAHAGSDSARTTQKLREADIQISKGMKTVDSMLSVVQARCYSRKK